MRECIQRSKDGSCRNPILYAIIPFSRIFCCAGIECPLCCQMAYNAARHCDLLLLSKTREPYGSGHSQSICGCVHLSHKNKTGEHQIGTPALSMTQAIVNINSPPFRLQIQWSPRCVSRDNLPNYQSLETVKYCNLANGGGWQMINA